MSDIWEQLKPRLEFFERPYPAEAIALANVHREEVAPHLIAVIESIADDPTAARNGEYMLHLFAMHLLASWRDERAYRPLACWGRFSEEVLDDLLGDVLHESYGRCLASLCDGDLAPIKALVEDKTASDWTRGAALTALGVRVLEESDTRDSLIGYLQTLGAIEADRVRVFGPTLYFDVLDGVVSVACDIGATEMLETIRQWFAEDLIDETFADLGWVEQDIARPFAEHQAKELSRNNGYVRDVTKEIAWFASYREDEFSASKTHAPPWPPINVNDETYVRPFPKLGRNDPCPCGSGKKFKKCHGA